MRTWFKTLALSFCFVGSAMAFDFNGSWTGNLTVLTYDGVTKQTSCPIILISNDKMVVVKDVGGCLITPDETIAFHYFGNEVFLKRQNYSRLVGTISEDTLSFEVNDETLVIKKLANGSISVEQTSFYQDEPVEVTGTLTPGEISVGPSTSPKRKVNHW